MLPSETVLAIFEDPNWRMWIGTQNGLVRLEATSVQVVPLPNGTEADYGTISEASDSNSWMVVGRLFRVNTHKAERVVESGVPEDGLRSVFQARDGSVWVGTDGGGAYHCEASGHIVHLLAPRELQQLHPRVQGRLRRKCLDRHRSGYRASCSPWRYRKIHRSEWALAVQHPRFACGSQWRRLDRHR